MRGGENQAGQFVSEGLSIEEEQGAKSRSTGKTANSREPQQTGWL